MVKVAPTSIFTLVKGILIYLFIDFFLNDITLIKCAWFKFSPSMTSPK